MKDQSRKKQVLIQELVSLRQRIAELEQSELERKRAEEALQQSYKRFRDIADNAAEWIWEVNAKGEYTYSSAVVEQLLGYKPEEILNKHFYDLFHPEDRKDLRKAAFEVFTNKKPFRKFLNRNLHKNGKTVWLSTSGVPILDEKGKLMGYRGADTDVTDRKRADETLQTSLIKYQTLFHALPIGVTISDKAGKIIDSNREAERLLGSQLEEHVKRMIDSQEWSIIRPDGSPMPADEYAGVRAMKENRLIENVEMGIIKDRRSSEDQVAGC
jgi:PAS domain S-box-containing protein